MKLKKKSAEIEFLNVDLELRAGSGLDVLVKALDPKMYALHHDRKFACLELNQDPRSPEHAVLRILRVIRDLPPQARKRWKQCGRRTLNIGIAAPGRTGRAVQAGYVLSKETVSMAAAERVEIAFTVYVR